MATYPLRTAIADTYPNPSNSVARAGMGQLWDYTTSIPHGQCRLVKSGANLVLQRYNGQWLRINDVTYSIPSAGVALAATGLSVGTTYFIYAYMSGATMTLEASTTGHSTDSTTGVEIKTGDATRTLVGMARPITGPAWQDVVNQRFVISWFNRRPVFTQAAIAGNITSASTSFVEIYTGLRNEFLCWGADALSFDFDGRVSQDTINALAFSAIAVDTTVADSGSAFQAYANNVTGSPACSAVMATTEGYHYATVLGATGGAGTALWAGSGFPGSRCTLKGVIQG